MDFVKKHYEKALLSIVLLGLVGVGVFMLIVIPSDQQKQKEMSDTIIRPKVTPLPALDLARQTGVLSRLQSPPDYDFATTNKLFNPLEWKRGADGRLIKIMTGHEVDAEAAVVTKITPLNLVLTLDSVETNAPEPRYVIGVERQAAAVPVLRRKQQRYASVNEKKDVFTITKIEGAPENPDQLLLKLTDTGDTVAVSKGKPFQRAEAYAADLRYDPDQKKNLTARRVGMPVSFGGEDYIIVAINQNEVVLSAQSNQKKTTLRYAP